RVGPGLGYPEAAGLTRTSTVQATCQTDSAKAVNGTRTWYGLVGGPYVSAADATVAPGGPLPTCDPKAWAGQYTPAVARDRLRARGGPGQAYPVQRTIVKGSRLEVVCRTDAPSAVNGSPTWYRLGEG